MRWLRDYTHVLHKYVLYTYVSGRRKPLPAAETRRQRFVHADNPLSKVDDTQIAGPTVIYNMYKSLSSGQCWGICITFVSMYHILLFFIVFLTIGMLFVPVCVRVHAPNEQTWENIQQIIYFSKHGLFAVDIAFIHACNWFIFPIADCSSFVLTTQTKADMFVLHLCVWVQLNVQCKRLAVPWKGVCTEMANTMQSTNDTQARAYIIERCACASRRTH